MRAFGPLNPFRRVDGLDENSNYSFYSGFGVFDRSEESLLLNLTDGLLA